MYLWLISQNENNGYDTYDSAVVVAANIMEAKKTLPGGGSWSRRHSHWASWASSPDKVTAVALGRADDPTPRVVCASYNAG